MSRLRQILAVFCVVLSFWIIIACLRLIQQSSNSTPKEHSKNFLDQFNLTLQQELQQSIFELEKLKQNSAYQKFHQLQEVGQQLEGRWQQLQRSEENWDLANYLYNSEGKVQMFFLEDLSYRIHLFDGQYLEERNIFVELENPTLGIFDNETLLIFYLPFYILKNLQTEKHFNICY